MLRPWPKPPAAMPMGAPHLLWRRRHSRAFDLFSRTPGKPLLQVLGADDGGASMSRSFLEASFWSGIGLGESSAWVVRGLGAGVEVGAAAPDLVIMEGCRHWSCGWKCRWPAWCAASGSAWMSERRLWIRWLGVGSDCSGDEADGSPGARPRGRRVGFLFVRRSGGSEDGCRVSAPVARAAEQAARLVRGLAVGVDAGAAASVFGCRVSATGCLGDGAGGSDGARPWGRRVC